MVNLIETSKIPQQSKITNLYQFDKQQKNERGIWHPVVLHVSQCTRNQGNDRIIRLLARCTVPSLVSRYENITHEQWPRESLEPNE